MSYSDVNYWNKRQNENILHEWYYSFEHLKPLIINYIKENNNLFKCLEIGCGNAPLLEGIISYYYYYYYYYYYSTCYY